MMNVQGDAYAQALREAIAEVVRLHVPGATGSGQVSGFLLSFDWVDVGATAGEQLVWSGRDPLLTVRRLSRTMSAPSPKTPDSQPRWPSYYRRRTDPPPPRAR